MDPARRLYRSTTNRVFAGVCGGLAEYFDLDPTIIRVLFVAMTFGGGFGFWLYIILWVVVPERGRSDEASSTATVQNNTGSAPTSTMTHWPARMVIGGLIVLIGLMALGNEFFPWHFFRWDILWPIIIIVIGTLIIIKRK